MSVFFSLCSRVLTSKKSRALYSADMTGKRGILVSMVHPIHSRLRSSSSKNLLIYILLPGFLPTPDHLQYRTSTNQAAKLGLPTNSCELLHFSLLTILGFLHRYLYPVINPAIAVPKTLLHDRNLLPTWSNHGIQPHCFIQSSCRRREIPQPTTVFTVTPNGAVPYNQGLRSLAGQLVL